MNAISLVQGDITTAHVDAIVNAANPRMLGGGGVDGAIHRAAGPALINACYAVDDVDDIRCPFGDARITEAGNLNARYVIHAVGRFTINSPIQKRCWNLHINVRWISRSPTTAKVWRCLRFLAECMVTHLKKQQKSRWPFAKDRNTRHSTCAFTCLLKRCFRYGNTP